MKKVLNIAIIILTAAIILVKFGGTNNSDTSYCSSCGKQVASDSRFCIFCGASLTENSEVIPQDEPAQPTVQAPAEESEPTNNPKLICTSFGRSDRTPTDSFKTSQTSYNVFSHEVTNCTGCRFNYKASRTGSSATGCNGKRDVYIRDGFGEFSKDDSSWTYVGSFEYDTEGEYVTVDLTWSPMDVYSMAVVRRNQSSYCSFSANWGDEVLLYSYQ